MIVLNESFGIVPKRNVVVKKQLWCWANQELDGLKTAHQPRHVLLHPLLSLLLRQDAVLQTVNLTLQSLCRSLWCLSSHLSFRDSKGIFDNLTFYQSINYLFFISLIWSWMSSSLSAALSPLADNELIVLFTSPNSSWRPLILSSALEAFSSALSLLCSARVNFLEYLFISY